MTIEYEARIHHAVHFMKRAATAAELYLQGGTDLQRGLQLLDSEWTNIQAGQAWACANMKEEGAAKLCNAYPDCAAPLLDLRLSPEERIRWRQLGLAAARR